MEHLAPVLPALASLIALQDIDTAADAHRQRLGEIPAAEQALETAVNDAMAAAEAVRERLAANQQARRELDRDVAGVDTRLSRFDDHKAAVKTNQEYQALLHEIATARGEKEAIEDRILVLMEEADGIAEELRTAEAAVAEARRSAEEGRAALQIEQGRLDAEVARLAAERARAAAAVDAPLLAKYEQILKNRRGAAVVAIDVEVCTACHVRLRPHVSQQIRRNDSIVQCESCQRILFWPIADAR